MREGMPFCLSVCEVLSLLGSRDCDGLVSWLHGYCATQVPFPIGHDLESICERS